MQGRPQLLTFVSAQHPLRHTPPVPTRRSLWCKTTVPNAAQFPNGMLASRCIVVQEACSHKRRRTSQ